MFLDAHVRPEEGGKAVSSNMGKSFSKWLLDVNIIELNGGFQVDTCE